jgi:hypothetical protein
LYKTISTATLWARQKATSTTIAWSSNWSGNCLSRINLTRLNSKSTKTTSSSCQKAGTATFMYGLKKHCRTKGPGRPSKMVKTILRKKSPLRNCLKSLGSLSPLPIPIKLDCGTMSRAGWCMFWRSVQKRLSTRWLSRSVSVSRYCMLRAAMKFCSFSSFRASKQF